jgi:NAD-dependent deacetylase
MTRQELARDIEWAAQLLEGSSRAVALTGAGISVESGVPAFRGSQGLWAKYEPMEYASIEGFVADPAKVWKMLAELDRTVREAAPNPAHLALAEFERKGMLDMVITQNIDGLHQAAGSRQVAELHGSGTTLSCLSCRKQVSREDIRIGPELPPRCSCGGVLKPDIVFFGESLPLSTFTMASVAASNCDLMLVVGTSAVVVPASELPYLAKAGGAKIIEINLEPSPLSRSVSDVVIMGSAAKVLQELLEMISSSG